MSRPHKSRMDSDTQQKTGGTILVTGGSGFVGRHLVKKLCERHTVVSMYRHRLPEPMSDVYPVCSDLESMELLKAPLRGVDTVVYLAWERSDGLDESLFNVDPDFTQMTPNIRHLRNMIQAMEAVGTRRMILVSASGASRNAPNSFLREKYIAEFALVNSSIPEKLIVRPTIVYEGDAQRDRFVQAILNIIKFPGVYPVPKIAGDIAPIHVADLCTVIGRLARRNLHEPIGIVEVFGQERYDLAEVFKLVAERYSRRNKLQVRGVLGDSFLALMEKTQGEVFRSNRIRDHLIVGHKSEMDGKSFPAMAEVVPKDMISLRKTLTLARELG